MKKILFVLMSLATLAVVFFIGRNSITPKNVVEIKTIVVTATPRPQATPKPYTTPTPYPTTTHPPIPAEYAKYWSYHRENYGKGVADFTAYFDVLEESNGLIYIKLISNRSSYYCWLIHIVHENGEISYSTLDRFDVTVVNPKLFNEFECIRQ